MGALEVKAAAQAQKKAQGHQIRMMKNAHQWEIGDLLAAGLNPILSATGSGPQGYSAAAPAVGGDQIASMAEGLKSGVTAAKEVAMFDSNLRAIRGQATKTEEEGAKAHVEEEFLSNTFIQRQMIMDANVSNAQELLRQNQANANTAEIETELQRSLLPSARAAAEAQSSRAGQTSKKIGTIMENITQPLRGIVGGSANIHRGTTTIKSERKQRRKK